MLWTCSKRAGATPPYPNRSGRRCWSTGMRLLTACRCSMEMSASSCPDPLAALRDDHSPGVHHHAVTVTGSLARRRGAPLTAGRHVAAVLDGPGAQQRFPVVDAGGGGESGRYDQDMGALQSQSPVEFWKAQVVADAETEAHPLAIHRHHGISGRDHRRLVVGGAIGKTYVEEVDLAVASDLFATAVEHHAGVVAGPSPFVR